MRTDRHMGAGITYILLTILFITAPLALDAQTTGQEQGNSLLAIASLEFVDTADHVEVALEHFRLIPTSKRISDDHERSGIGMYACVITDNRHAPLDTVYLGNPLMPRFEYPTDTEEIGSVELPFRKNSVLIRFRYTPEMRVLRIAQMDANRRWSTLTQIPLPEIKR